MTFEYAGQIVEITSDGALNCSVEDVHEYEIQEKMNSKRSI